MGSKRPYVPISIRLTDNLDFHDVSGESFPASFEELLSALRQKAMEKEPLTTGSPDRKASSEFSGFIVVDERTIRGDGSVLYVSLFPEVESSSPLVVRREAKSQTMATEGVLPRETDSGSHNLSSQFLGPPGASGSRPAVEAYPYHHEAHEHLSQLYREGERGLDRRRAYEQALDPVSLERDTLRMFPEAVSDVDSNLCSDYATLADFRESLIQEGGDPRPLELWWRSLAPQ